MDSGNFTGGFYRFKGFNGEGTAHENRKRRGV